MKDYQEYTSNLKEDEIKFVCFTIGNLFYVDVYMNYNPPNALLELTLLN